MWVMDRRLASGAVLVATIACGGVSERSPADSGGAAGVPDPSSKGGTSAGGTSSGAPGNGGNCSSGASCQNDVPRSAEDERVTNIALEASRAARAEQIVPLTITLVDPEFDFGRLSSGDEDRDAVIAEREAQLAPFQDPIEERLRALGADDVSSMWLVNVVFGSILAPHVKEVPSWPAVVRVELAVDYWAIAPPPWDSAAVGSEACPIGNAECPAHCSRVLGSRFDPGGACMGPGELVSCSRIEFPAVNEWPGECGARTETGDLFRFPGIVPVEPGYVGFRPCTTDEADRTAGIPSCQ
ncbi:MAG TPA: hypothetical protein VFZ53_20330 [Polyangiaceae bacterium]